MPALIRFAIISVALWCKITIVSTVVIFGAVWLWCCAGDGQRIWSSRSDQPIPPWHRVCLLLEETGSGATIVPLRAVVDLSQLTSPWAFPLGPKYSPALSDTVEAMADDEPVFLLDYSLRTARDGTMDIRFRYYEGEGDKYTIRYRIKRQTVELVSIHMVPDWGIGAMIFALGAFLVISFCSLVLAIGFTPVVMSKLNRGQHPTGADSEPCVAD